MQIFVSEELQELHETPSHAINVEYYIYSFIYTYICNISP